MHDPSALFNWCTEVTQDSNLVFDPLAVEASHRRFYRLHSNTNPVRRWVAMDSPPELEQNQQFLTMAMVFADHDIPVPTIIDKDMTRGFMLMNDLGALDLAQAYASPVEEAALRAAVDTLIELQDVQSPHIPPYDEALLTMEFELFEEWVLRQLLGDAGNDLAAKYATALAHTKNACIAAMLAQPQVCVHRDYHCRNVLFNHGQIGVVDFQDALAGPALYDIASLLRDCYYQHDERTIDYWLDYFLSRSAHFNTNDFAATKSAFDHTAIQRQIKAMGIFARLHIRDAKSSHLRWIKPVVHSLITSTGAYDDTQDLNQLLGELLPRLEDKLGARS
jgi:aminoglycoside/choline kinase family phosphotransferase